MEYMQVNRANGRAADELRPIKLTRGVMKHAHGSCLAEFGDTRAEADKLWGKLRGLRINEDENGKTNLALADVDGEVLVVSQFTLFADCRHGRRPSFTDAGAPDVANELYEYFLTLVREDVEHVAHGIFGADMKVDLVNDGPFTIVLDTDNL